MADYVIRNFVEGDEERIVKLFNEAYGNFSGYVPRTVEYWRWCCLKRPDVRKDGIFLLFNKVGFQMVPSKKECEKALAQLPKPNVLAISILAAGYLKPPEAIDYIAQLPNIKGVAVGVSKEKHANETFKLLREKLDIKYAPC